MPTLKTYTAQARPAPISGGRRASGEDFAGFDASGLVKTVASAANVYVTDLEENESRKVLVSQAEIRAKYAKRLDEAAINGEDLGKIKEDLTNEMSTISEGLVTRKAADTAALHAANTSAVFDNQANNIAVTRAVTEARVEGAKFLNATGAIIANNPSYLPQAEADADAFVATLTRLPVEKRKEIAANLKNNMNVAAAMVNARRDPEATKAAVQGGAYNLEPGQRQQVIGEAETAIRARRAEEAYIRADKEYQERERNEEAYDKNFKAIMGGTATRKDIMNDPNLKPNTREHLIVFMEARAKSLASGDRKSDPGVLNDLYLRIIAPEGTPGKIYTIDPIFEAVKARMEGKPGINTTDAERLRGIVASQKDGNNRAIGARMNGVVTGFGRELSSNQMIQSFAAADPGLVSEIQQTYAARVEQRMEDMRKSGTSPNEVFNPDSKMYVGSREFKAGVIDEVMSQKVGKAPPAQPGEETVIDGVKWRFKGGDPANKQNWEQIGAAPAAPVVNDFQAWMAATGGKLKPGQTQAQAIAEWKAGK